VKDVEPVTDLEGLLEYTVVANFRALGPKAGPNMPAVKAALAKADAGALRSALEAEGSVEIELENGEHFLLSPDDVEVRAGAHDELVLAQDGDIAVALDIALDHELRLEGLARELIRALNDQRKSSGLAIDDRIRVVLAANGPPAEAVRHHRDWIAREALAVELDMTETSPADAGAGHTIDVDGTAVGIRLERAPR